MEGKYSRKREHYVQRHKREKDHAMPCLDNLKQVRIAGGVGREMGSQAGERQGWKCRQELGIKRS